MNCIYLERYDPDQNMHRFYQLFVSPGTVRKDWFDTEPEALEAAGKVFDAKKKKGYRVLIG